MFWHGWLVLCNFSWTNIFLSATVFYIGLAVTKPFLTALSYEQRPMGSFGKCKPMWQTDVLLPCRSCPLAARRSSAFTQIEGLLPESFRVHPMILKIDCNCGWTQTLQLSWGSSLVAGMICSRLADQPLFSLPKLEDLVVVLKVS